MIIDDDALREGGNQRSDEGALEDIHRLCGTALYPKTKLSVLSAPGPTLPAQRFSNLGPVVIGDIILGTDVRVDCGDLGTSYHVNLPLTGRLTSEHRGEEVTGSPERAVVYRPNGETVLTRWEADCRQLCVKIDRTALDNTLENMLGRRVASSIEFDPSMTTTTGPGRSWAQMVLMLNEQFREKEDLFLRPMIALPLAESLIHGLLLAAGHPDRELLATANARVHSPAVRAATCMIQDDPMLPFTTSWLAEQTRVSVRTLQQSFRLQLNMSPMAYVREVRLRHAHDALRAADPYSDSVASIAYEWGFTHLGRFAAAYEAKYGELPHQTLRAPKQSQDRRAPAVRCTPDAAATITS